MMKLSFLFTLVIASLAISLDPRRVPSRQVTPGVLCTKSDPSYIGEHYGISKCKRKVTKDMKAYIARLYGVSFKDLGRYEVDHMIPLGLGMLNLIRGGSNSVMNLWPQYRDGGQKWKSAVDQLAYTLLSNGTIDQAEAIQMNFDVVNRWYGLMGDAAYRIYY